MKAVQLPVSSQSNYPFPSYVQEADVESSAGGVTSTFVGFTKAQTAGNCNLVYVGLRSLTSITTPVSVTDTRKNTYVRIGEMINPFGQNFSIYVYAALNITAAPASGNTVTVTFSGSAISSYTVYGVEYAGVTSVSAVNFALGTLNASVTLTTSAYPTLISVFTFGTGASAAATATPGFTIRRQTVVGGSPLQVLADGPGHYPGLQPLVTIFGAGQGATTFQSTIAAVALN